MRKAKFRDIARLSWLAARAYANRQSGWNFLLCTISYPLQAFSLVPFIISGETYTTPDADAMVIIFKNGSGWQAWLRWASYAAELVIFLTISVALALVSPLFILAIFALLMLNSVVVIVQNIYSLPAICEMLISPPKGEYWTISGLAQHPKSRFVGLQLAQEAARSVPAGEILLLTARSNRHARIYQRYGFTPTRPGSLIMTKRSVSR